MITCCGRSDVSRYSSTSLSLSSHPLTRPLGGAGCKARVARPFGSRESPLPPPLETPNSSAATQQRPWDHRVTTITNNEHALQGLSAGQTPGCPTAHPLLNREQTNWVPDVTKRLLFSRVESHTSFRVPYCISAHAHRCAVKCSALVQQRPLLVHTC